MNSEFVVALHAMVFLYHKKERISSEELAENVCTNPVCVRRVMAKIAKAGLVDTQSGRGRGYRYPEGRKVTLREISEALSFRFVDNAWRSGASDKPCLIASGMAGYMDSLYRRFDELLREQLEGITVADVEETLCGSQKSFYKH